MDDSEQGLDLFKYLGVIIHWWWVIVVVAVLSVATAYTYSTLTKTTVYRAQATILIQESGSGRALGLSDVQASGRWCRPTASCCAAPGFFGWL